MLVKTRVFELYRHKYDNLSELAQVMGISVSQIYRVRQGKRNINQKFIIGAVKAFPGRKLESLFYFVPDSPSVIEAPRHRAEVADYPANQRARVEKGKAASQAFSAITGKR